jgi:energy-coupling factor transporter ATP-binding protein EcfA2
MSRFSYHARYELIEFAVYTLAARSQELVPLHAACVGIDGRGVLLMGGSGSGKSTLSLQSLMQGLDFVSEDSIFVEPATLRATGIANFLHVRPDALRWLQSSRIATAIRKSPVIKRRSGVEKYELDLRRTPFKLAAAPLQIVAVAFLSARTTRGALLRRVAKNEALTRLADLQAYGTSRPQWRAFARNIARKAVFELRRGGHPAEAAAALRGLLAQQ